MANNDRNNKYSRNRNLWRKTYGFRRRKPKVSQFVDSNTGVTFSYDLNTTLRHRDFFIIKGFNEQALTSSITSSIVFAEYDEGLVVFNNSDTAVANFSSCFSNTPDAVVLTVESSPNFDDNIIPFGISFNSCSMSIGLSAPFSGSVRYRAVYSSTGYPALVTSSFVPASGTFQVSAGHITASMATNYTASFSAGTGSLNFFAKTAWDFFNNTDNNVFISEDVVSTSSVEGSISAELSNPIYFVAFF